MLHARWPSISYKRNYNIYFWAYIVYLYTQANLKEKKESGATDLLNKEEKSLLLTMIQVKKK